MSYTSNPSNDAIATTAGNATAASATATEKQNQHPSKKDRPTKTQMKQSSLEANEVTLGRQDSWRKRICERTRRSRSTEEDYGDNTNDLSKNADLIEERLYLGTCINNYTVKTSWLKIAFVIDVMLCVQMLNNG